MLKKTLYLLCATVFVTTCMSGCLATNKDSSKTNIEKTESSRSQKDEEELEVLEGIDIDADDNNVNEQINEQLHKDIEANGVVIDDKK